MSAPLGVDSILSSTCAVGTGGAGLSGSLDSIGGAAATGSADLSSSLLRVSTNTSTPDSTNAAAPPRISGSLERGAAGVIVVAVISPTIGVGASTSVSPPTIVTGGSVAA